MSNSPESAPLKSSYPLSGNTAGAAKSLQQKHNHQQQKEEKHNPGSAVFPEQQHHKKDKFQQTNQSSYDHDSEQRQQTPVKVPRQPSATWVSPKQDDDYSKPLVGGQSGQEPERHLSSAGDVSNVSYEEFIEHEEQQHSALLDPETGFPTCWPNASRTVLLPSPPPQTVPAPPVERPSPEKDFPPVNVPRIVRPPSPVPTTVPPPSHPPRLPPPSPPPRPRGGGCCIIL